MQRYNGFTNLFAEMRDEQDTVVVNLLDDVYEQGFDLSEEQLLGVVKPLQSRVL